VTLRRLIKECDALATLIKGCDVPANHIKECDVPATHIKECDVPATHIKECDAPATHIKECDTLSLHECFQTFRRIALPSTLRVQQSLDWTHYDGIKVTIHSPNDKNPRQR
jgi:hypothetical protein